MLLRIPLALGLVFLILAVAAGPAFAWGEAATREIPRGAVAGCLRAAGNETIAATGAPTRRNLPYDILGLGDLELRETLQLGNPFSCPAIDRVAGGPLATAFLDVPRRGPAVLRASANGAMSTLDTTRDLNFGDTLVAASSPTGEALVAWVATRDSRHKQLRPDGARLMVSRAPAGEPFGPAIALTGWRRLETLAQLPVVAARYDGAGRPTLAWASPRPPDRRIEGLAQVEVFGAEPGQGLSLVQVVKPVSQDLDTLALAVTPDGRALMAFDGSGTVRVVERTSPQGRFDSVPIPGMARMSAADPTIGMLSDGGAVIGWAAGSRGNNDDGIRLAARPSGIAPFAPARTVIAGTPTQAFLGTVGVITLPGRPHAPIDEGNVRVSTAVDALGRFTLAWGAKRVTQAGDEPTVAWAVAGSLDGDLGPIARLSCPCRSVNGVRAVVAPAGPGVAFTDNATQDLLETEIAAGAGRLRLMLPSLRGRPAAPPALRVRVRPRTLGFDEPLPIRVGCDRACDVRAVVAPRGRPGKGSLAMGIASLPRAGVATIALRPSSYRNVAPPGGGSVRIVVRAYARDGRRFDERVVRVRLERKPVAPLPRPADVSARRQGQTVVVTWTYPSRPRDVVFLVEGRIGRSRWDARPQLGHADIEHRPDRERQRVVLHPSRPERVRFVAVTVAQIVPPRRHVVVVPVTR